MSEKDTGNPTPQTSLPAATAPSPAIPWFNLATPFDPTLEGSTPAVQILILWGDTVIFAEHLTPPRSFFVGEADSDYIMPAETLGAPRIPLVLARWDGLVNLVLPQAASGTVAMDGIEVTLQDAARTASARPSSALKGAVELPLMPGFVAWIHVGGFSFRVSTVRAGLPFERSRHIPRRAWAAQGVSTAVHLLLLGTMAFLQPSVFDLERYEISPDQQYELQKRLAEIDDKEEERQEQRNELLERGKTRRGVMRGPEYWYAALSLPSAPVIPASTSHQAGWVDSRDFSVIGLMYEPSAGHSSAASTGGSQDAAATTARTAPARSGASAARETLPPEVIHRIVRQSFGRFRLCYENGLRMNPNLQGRVTVRFIIGVDGQVSNISSGGSDLPDGAVVRCVLSSFYGLTFPSPGKGIGTVVYPILFSPGG
jgi:hypothetical protein